MGGKKTVENNRRFERDRRNKLNIAFEELCKLLPDHDPSITLSKMEILKKAALYIKYLQEQNDEIMKIGKDIALEKETEYLKKRVANLLLKTNDLVDALKSAGVPIPTYKRSKKKNPGNKGQNSLAVNQNIAENEKHKDGQTSKDSSYKMSTCDCMNLKQPLKGPNASLTTSAPVVFSENLTTPSSQIIMTNNQKLTPVTIEPLITAPVMTTRVQNELIVKNISHCPMPNLNSTTVTSISEVQLGSCSLMRSKLPGECNGASNVNSSLVASRLQTISIMNKNIVPTNIGKEVTHTILNTKAINVVTTTNSNVLTTQTIVNSTPIITIAQNTVAPRIQTVPVIEKNVLTNLGPGTLILADGRIVNVPPIVPQILMKPQPTVILMPNTKRKEKLIVPKKREVTKTTFANKAPIPAIKTFRLESCPRIRPKKKPKVLLKNPDKAKNKNSLLHVKKKRKLDDILPVKDTILEMPSAPLNVEQITTNVETEQSDLTTTDNQIQHVDIHSIITPKDPNTDFQCEVSVIEKEEVSHGKTANIELPNYVDSSLEVYSNESKPPIKSITAENSTKSPEKEPLVNFNNNPGKEKKSTEISETSPYSTFDDREKDSGGTVPPSSISSIPVSCDENSPNTSQSLALFSTNTVEINSDNNLEIEECVDSRTMKLISSSNSESHISIEGSVSINVNSKIDLPTNIETPHTQVPKSAQSHSNTVPDKSAPLCLMDTLITNTIQDPLFIPNSLVGTDSLIPKDISITSNTNMCDYSCTTSSQNVQIPATTVLPVISNSTGDKVSAISDTNEILETLPQKESSIISNSNQHNQSPNDANEFVDSTLNFTNLSSSEGNPNSFLNSSTAEALPVTDERMFPTMRGVNQISTSMSGLSNFKNASIYAQTSGVFLTPAPQITPEKAIYSQQNFCANSLTSVGSAGPIVTRALPKFSEIQNISVLHSGKAQQAEQFAMHTNQTQSSILQMNNSKPSQSVNNFQGNIHASYTPTSHSSTPYNVSSTLLSNKAQATYNREPDKSSGFSSTDKYQNCNTLPFMTSINSISASSENLYPTYCSTSFYTPSNISYSQSSFALNPPNKATESFSNESRKVEISAGFNQRSSSDGKHFTPENNSFSHNAVLKPTHWDESPCNKISYNSLSGSSHEQNILKNAFQFNKGSNLDKQNSNFSQLNILYPGFQNEPTVTCQSNSIFPNFPPTSLLQSTCGFNDTAMHITTETNTGLYNPSHSMNLQGTSSSYNPNNNVTGANTLPTSVEYSKSHSVMNFERVVSNRNSFYPTSSKPGISVERSRYSSCSDNRTQTCPATLQTKGQTPQNLPLSVNLGNMTKSSSMENQKTQISNVNSGEDVQFNKMSDNNTINMTENTSKNSHLNHDPNNKTRNQINTSTYPMRKDNLQSADQFSDSTACISEKNVHQESPKSNCTAKDPSPLNTGTTVDSNSYNNYPSIRSKGKNIHQQCPETPVSSNETVAKTSQNNVLRSEEKVLSQEIHHMTSQSTEVADVNSNNFNFNSLSAIPNHNYQKLMHSRNSSFASNLTKFSEPLNKDFSNLNNTSYGALNRQFNAENTRTTSVCTTQSISHLLPSGSAIQTDPATQKVSKTVPVSVISQSPEQKPDKTVQKSFTGNGDITSDFLKSKDLERNTFIPIIDDVRLPSDFSTDLFSSLQVPPGVQHSESISPTAAFLLAFPLVSTSRNIENLPDSENQENQTSTPTTILQIGNIDPPSTELFHPIEFQKTTSKSSEQFDLNSAYLHVGIQGKQNTEYKRCGKRKDDFNDFPKETRPTDSKQKPKTSAATTSTYTQSYSYPLLSCNEFQFCDKEGPQWPQECAVQVSKDQKKLYDRKKDKGVQKGCFYQSYQEYCTYKEKKKKQVVSNRISVNWMAGPESREQADYQQGIVKDAEITNNFVGHSSQTVYSSIPLDFPSEPFPDFNSSKKTANNYSWSPSKSLLPSLDNHLMIPSTLPTLVGDLALGTSTPSESYKTFEIPKIQAQGQITKKNLEKSDENKNKRNDFPKSQANFFSVSQLVDPKSKKQKPSDRNYKKLEKNSKPRSNFNCSKRKEDQCMYYEDRNSFMPNANQCNDKRHSYKGGSYSAESLIGVQPNDVDFSSNFNYQQNSNFFQSDYTHNMDGQQYGNFQQTHFTGFGHEDYQDFGFGTNQRGLEQSRQKPVDRKEDGYQGVLQPQVCPPYTKSSVQYNSMPTSHLNTNTTTTLTNFNLSTIFPEMNDQTVGTSGQQRQINQTFSSSQSYRSHIPQ